MNFIYKLENLKRYYVSKAETIKAIDGITLTIRPSSFVVLLGPSGSGKTTLLNLLAGLDQATSGSICFQEHVYSELTDSQFCNLRRFKIGIVFQFYNMHPSLTAKENIEYPMMIANDPKIQQQSRAEKLLKQVQMYEKRENLPAELSGGEKQRIGIARALANDPEVIIADEPTGDLDSDNAEMIIEYLRKVNQQGKTIIMVTHDESLLHDEMRLIHLNDGKVIDT